MNDNTRQAQSVDINGFDPNRLFDLLNGQSIMVAKVLTRMTSAMVVFCIVLLACSVFSGWCAYNSAHQFELTRNYMRDVKKIVVQAIPDKEESSHAKPPPHCKP